MGIQSLPANAGSSRVKKKIRDLERLIKKPNLAATKKIEAERALDVLRRDLGGAQQRSVEKKYSKKYHMIRFFERQKALRKLQKADSGDDELAAWYYVTRFPRDQKYASIFTENAVPSPFMDTVREQMKSGTLKTGEEARLEILKEQKKQKASAKDKPEAH